MPPAMAQNQQQLGSKEAALFRQLVKNYEQKQHKKGIKAADQILKKFPSHGDTQAMKALILNATGQTDDAFALGKIALKNSMKSNVCWHVYGLLWRSQKNYEEATKAYRMALNLEPESPQILRDLSLLQVQTRDYAGYAQSRTKMLNARNNFRQNWTALAIAHHLNGDLAQAEKVLDLFENSLTQKPPKTDVEHNEALMYKNTIMAESGDTQRALDHLDSISADILDKTSAMEFRAFYLLKLGRKDEADKAYRALLARNSELRAYYDGLEQALGIEPSDKQARKEMYESFSRQDEKLDAARRIPLDFLEGQDFHQAADHYLRRMLRKGVPSTFNNVKSLYSDKAKSSAIESLVESYKDEKQTNGNVNGADSDDDQGSRWEKSVLYFLAQHYNYKLTRNLNKAMAYTDRLIEIAPKTYDWYMNKARVYKHQGNPSEAAKWMDQARETDLRDRYINTKCAKYQLRNEQNDVALKTMSKFTRNEVLGGTLGDLIDMQQVGYLTEDGEAWARQGKLGLALKRFNTVYNIFETWHEDQFDFHSFSLRKAQIRAYVDMIRWEDQLRQHPYYLRPAIGAIKIYLALYDNKELVKMSDLPVGTTTHSDKETVRKARIEENKKWEAQKEADRKAAAKKSNVGNDGEAKKSDEDPRGRKLVEVKDPLGEAMKYLAPLMESGTSNLEAQLAGFEVYMRREKYYLALKCLLAAASVDQSHPSLHPALVTFGLALGSKAEAGTETLRGLASKLPTPYNKPLDKKTAVAVNDEFLSAHSKSLPAACAYVRAQAAIDPASKEQAAKRIEHAAASAEHTGLADGVEALRLMHEYGASEQEMKAVVARTSEKVGSGRELLDRELAR